MSEPALVNKYRLALALRWSRPRLDAYLGRHPSAPVVKRGAHRQAWCFDLAAMLAFVAVNPMPRKPPSNGWGTTRFTPKAQL